MAVILTKTDAEIQRCFPILKQLRPHLEENGFLERIHGQMEGGYQLAMIETEDRVVAVAGFRIQENLFSGRHLYVDDLITDSTQRSTGHGGELLDWLIQHAKNEACECLALDSGVHRCDAHRFYFKQRMSSMAYPFLLPLNS
ncbi:MAG: GNAT family N-acetyltransferase [Planctomycetota bacterium]|nr:GNAT family N-acetyltransferase [Planctomycetota bacterium]